MRVTIVMEKGEWRFKGTTTPTGADLLFDYIADGREELRLDVRSEPFEKAIELIYMGMAEDYMDGAYYYIEHYKERRIDLVVFFPDEFLFLPDTGMPRILYLKTINT